MIIINTKIRIIHKKNKNKDILIIVAKNSTGSIKINRTTVTIKQKSQENLLYGYFERQTS